MNNIGEPDQQTRVAPQFVMQFDITDCLLFQLKVSNGLLIFIKKTSDLNEEQGFFTPTCRVDDHKLLKKGVFFITIALLKRTLSKEQSSAESVQGQSLE